ncbi:MAG TPA: CDP-alcohol phosphatidyltransferase family protein [Gammaproteobacteria bacterium]|nr:CDP-alcohol phosphatidyltransferase family protein [Gammaproteobacteria bacterium]
MIDGYFKAKIDLFWNRIAQVLVALNLAPNMITWIGLLLVLASCLFYLLYENNLVFGLLLALSFSFDALDGAVARITRNASKYGGYLDAVIDRYQELAIYLVLAYVTNFWGICFLAITGSLLVSYNKARTAVEIPINNENWPDLTERLERIILVCAGLILDPFITMPAPLNNSFLFNIILLTGILAHITAIQRFFRARKMLRKKPLMDNDWQ